jgi:hypothetical protein
MHSVVHIIPKIKTYDVRKNPRQIIATNGNWSHIILHTFLSTSQKKGTGVISANTYFHKSTADSLGPIIT